MISHKWLFWTVFGCFMILAIAIFCFSKILKRVPVNYFVLFLFTVLSTYMVSSISSYQDPEVILIAAALTLGIFIALTTLSLCVTDHVAD